MENNWCSVLTGTRYSGKATGNSRFDRQKFPPPLSVKIPENSRYENTAYTSRV